MTRIEQMLAFNRSFVDNNLSEKFQSNKFPSKKTAILSCMDTRLTELLPAALGIKNGEVKIIKNAGGVVCHPFGSVMRSLLVAIYELGVNDILVIGHYDCGMQGLNPDDLIGKMENRGIPKETIDLVRACGVDLNDFLEGFNCIEQSVKDTVERIQSHPLIPADVQVLGFLMDPNTGKLDAVSGLG